MPLSLDEIGRSHGTDKRTGASSKMHGYLPHYEYFFEPLRSEPISLCEIGVYKGASLATWREYFPKARIVGVDINPETLQFRGDRVDVELIDQSNKHQLADLAARYGPFDIVIDDGSHRWDHQRISMANLIHHVKSGGFYVIEDIHTSYIDQYRGKDEMRFVDRLLSLSRHLIDPELSPAAEDDAFIRHVIPKVARVTFIKRAAVIHVA